MLLLGCIPGRDSHGSAVDVQLAHNAAAALQLCLARLGGPAHLAQAQQAHQDVLPGVLVRQEGFPPAISTVVPPYQLNLLWLHLFTTQFVTPVFGASL